MSDVKQMFADFFKRKLTTLSETWPSSSRPRPRGWLEEYRVEAFQFGYPTDQKVGALWSELSGKVYEVYHFQLSVVLALYDDGTILWLDDHADDLDFENFVRREGLSTWLPDRLQDVLSLLIETKLNYLGYPRLISGVAEVPAFTEEVRAWHTESKEGRESLLEQERRLETIAGEVQRPACVPDGTQGFHLSFCVWTKILGKIIKINCFFGSAGSFSYEAVQLTEDVGAFLVPR